MRDTINHHQHSSRGHSDESVALLKFREGIRAARSKVDHVDPLVLDRARHQSRHGLEPHKLARRIVVAIEPLPSKDSPLHNLMREAIRGRHQRPSEVIKVIRGHQRSSEVIRGHQRSSEVIRGHSLRYLVRDRDDTPGAHVAVLSYLMREAMNGNQTSSVVVASRYTLTSPAMRVVPI